MDTLFLTRFNSKTCLNTLTEELTAQRLGEEIYTKEVKDQFEVFSYSEALKAQRKLVDIRGRINYLERIIFYKQDEASIPVIDNPDAFDTGGYF